MIYWKNKPVNQLNRQELQEALLQSLKTSLEDNNTIVGDDIFKIFAFGFSTGVILVLTGLFIGSIL